MVQQPQTSLTIVINKHQSYSASASSCVTLEESIWSVEQGSQGLELLQYLGLGVKTHGQGLHQVASTANAKCNAITVQGRTQRLLCDTPFRALCHNSAALSSPESTDTGSKWQTAVATGNATVTGCRDKHSFRFQGVKYATISSRFSHSTYLPLFGSNIPALSYGLQCIQGSCSSSMTACSEDCLYLKIGLRLFPMERARTLIGRQSWSGSVAVPSSVALAAIQLSVVKQ